MKRYGELAPEQQGQAREKALQELLESIVQGVWIPGVPGLAAKIDEAWREVDAKRTPWFWAEAILDRCRAELEAMALDDARGAIYLEPGEYVIDLRAVHRPCGAT